MVVRELQELLLKCSPEKTVYGQILAISDNEEKITEIQEYPDIVIIRS